MSEETIESRIIHSRKTLGITAVVLIAALFAAAFFRWEQNKTAVSASATITYPKELSRVTFVAAGDVIPHQPVVQAAAAAAAQSQSVAEGSSPESKDAASHPAGDGGWDALFANVADVFRQADFAFVNLETPVA